MERQFFWSVFFTVFYETADLRIYLRSICQLCFNLSLIACSRFVEEIGVTYSNLLDNLTAMWKKNFQLCFPCVYQDNFVFD